MRYELPKEEFLYSGHIGCPGCGASLAMRYALQALGKKTMVVIPACCWSTVGGFFPSTSLKVPILHTAFESAAITASGVKKGLVARGIEDVQVMAWAGDGGTFDIGLQSLSGSAERNDDIIYVCYDNEAYMNTGHPEKLGDSLPELDHHHSQSGLQGDAQERHHGNHGRPSHSVCGHSSRRPFLKIYLNKMRKAKEVKGPAFHPYSIFLPARLEIPIRALRQNFPLGRRDQNLSPL